jgi:hypothetical protein
MKGRASSVFKGFFNFERTAKLRSSLQFNFHKRYNVVSGKNQT